MAEHQFPVRLHRRDLLRVAAIASGLVGAAVVEAACGASTTAAPSTASGSASSVVASTAAPTTATSTSAAVATSAVATTVGTTTPASASSTTSATETVAPSPTPAATASAQKSPTTIQYWTWDQYSLDALNKNFLPQFEAQHPDIKVQGTYVEWTAQNGYYDKLQAIGVSADAPDVYYQSIAYTWDFANNGFTLNISPYVNRSLKLDDYFTALIDIFRFPTPKSGDLYAFPADWGGSLLFYNKNLLQQAGIDPPDNNWDYNKLMDVAGKLTVHSTDAAKAHFGTVFSTGYSSLDAMINAYGGQVLNDDYTKCMLDQKAATDTVQLAADAGTKLGISPKPGDKIGGQPVLFENGNIALDIEASFEIKIYREKAKFDWDVAMVPKGPVRRTIYGGPDGVAISSMTRHPDAAWAFLQAYCGPGRPASSFAGGSAPVYKPTANDPAWLEQGQLPAHKKILLDSAPYIQGAEFNSHWIEWRSTVMNKELAPAFAGTKSALDACHSATAAIDAILAQVKINKQVHPNL